MVPALEIGEHHLHSRPSTARSATTKPASRAVHPLLPHPQTWQRQAAPTQRAMPTGSRSLPIMRKLVHPQRGLILPQGLLTRPTGASSRACPACHCHGLSVWLRRKGQLSSRLAGGTQQAASLLHHVWQLSRSIRSQSSLSTSCLSCIEFMCLQGAPERGYQDRATSCSLHSAASQQAASAAPCMT